MFDIGAPEIAILAVLAIVIFGPERLPELARKAAQVLHYVRGLATQAQQQLGDELGPEFKNMDFRDLNPKQFVKKHLLDEVEPLISDVKAEIQGGVDDVKGMASGLGKEFDPKGLTAGGPGALDLDSELVGAMASVAPYDPEAT